MTDEQHYDPDHFSKREFGQRVYRRMVALNIRQSDLARLSGLTRNAISTYIRGMNFPTHHSLLKLAKALKTEPEELLPNFKSGLGAVTEQQGDLSISTDSKNPNLSRVFINRLIRTDAAMEILAILERERKLKAQAGERPRTAD